LKYARDVHAPTLIVHSGTDFRVPIEQDKQWLRALQHFGVLSDLVLLPCENHDVTVKASVAAGQ
jgi:dipeptidyl aminopeptidase/acylaminoacyl peptidase